MFNINLLKLPGLHQIIIKLSNILKMKFECFVTSCNIMVIQ